MPLTPGLNPSIRQAQGEPEGGLEGLEDIMVEKIGRAHV